MRVSELSPEDVRRFARMEEASAVPEEMDPAILLTAAVAYVRGQTGLSEEELDDYEDITVAVLVLCADLYENRLTTVDSANPNRTVEAILGMHRRNFV